MKRAGGFTLLEVLVALAILAIAAATLGAANAANLRKTEKARETTRRAYLIRGKLAEILLAPPPAAQEDTGWVPFTDDGGQPVETDLAWRKTAVETLFANPANGEAMKGLSDKERLALHAFYLQDMDADQACLVVGVSRSGLYHVLARARRRLARVLRKEEVSP